MTRQQPDTIRLDGQLCDLLATPLDSLIGANPFVAPNTANYRGYLARWSVLADVLHLDEVTAWVGGQGDAIREIDGSAMFQPWNPPIYASWVSGPLDVGRDYSGPGYGSIVTLTLEQGRVVGRSERIATPPRDSVGPYELGETVSGGAFGQVFEILGASGTALVGKVARLRGGRFHTQLWRDGYPVHVPADAFRMMTAGEWGNAEVSADLIVSILEAERELLEADAGVLLPAFVGLWTHERSGRPTLVMERLVGRRPESARDVHLVLLALADAVDRGSLAEHGDLKFEHIFIGDDDRVRICDPAPRFGDASWRAYTPAYNPRAWCGVAADVAACASMIAFVGTGESPIAYQWARALLAAGEPPDWAHSHRATAFILGNIVHGRDPDGAIGQRGLRPLRRSTTPRLEAPIPDGWLRKESVTLSAPDLQANVVISSDPIDPTVDVMTFACRQGEVIRREFPGYREISFGLQRAFGAAGCQRTFSWQPPDGESVTQIQYYQVESGRSYLATATSLSADFASCEVLLRQILSDITFVAPDGSVDYSNAPRTSSM